MIEIVQFIADAWQLIILAMMALVIVPFSS